jgi:hypothetical protein
MSPISNASFSAAYSVAVAKKQLDGVKQQGQTALALIQTATAAPAAGAVEGAARVGSRLNLYI